VSFCQGKAGVQFLYHGCADETTESECEQKGRREPQRQKRNWSRSPLGRYVIIPPGSGFAQAGGWLNHSGWFPMTLVLPLQGLKTASQATARTDPQPTQAPICSTRIGSLPNLDCFSKIFPTKPTQCTGFHFACDRNIQVVPLHCVALAQVRPWIVWRLGATLRLVRRPPRLGRKCKNEDVTYEITCVEFQRLLCFLSGHHGVICEVG